MEAEVTCSSKVEAEMGMEVEVSCSSMVAEEKVVMESCNNVMLDVVICGGKVMEAWSDMPVAAVTNPVHKSLPH